MKERKSRKKLRIRHFLILAAIVYLGIVFINQQKIIKALENEKVQKQEKIEQLNSEIKDIEEKLKYTDSLEYIEKMAREELKMIKADEIIYIDKNKNKDESNEGIDN